MNYLTLFRCCTIERQRAHQVYCRLFCDGCDYGGGGGACERDPEVVGTVVSYPWEFRRHRRPQGHRPRNYCSCSLLFAIRRSNIITCHFSLVLCA